MYNILIFGTSNSATIVENYLNNNINILAYLDNDKSKWDKARNNIIITSPNNIKEYNYDYVIIASQFNAEIYKQLIDMGIENNKIFQLYVFMDNNFNYYKYSIDRFIKLGNDVKLISTGISYAAKGFREDVCLKKSFSFAFSGQDLFYDYQTFKYILTKIPRRINSIEYALIGLCYYSFQYDMSLSATANKIILYYPVLKMAHHFKDIEKVYGDYRINKNIADNIFRKNQKGKYDFKWSVPTLKDYSDKRKIGREAAVRDCNKNYPQTVEENKSIFIDYLKLLREYGIKPVVVVYPASRYYSKYFSDRIEKKFHSIINRVKLEYDFQYIDYFRSSLFEDDDFGDVSHLNRKGAEKFTRILNKEIEW